MSTYICIDGYDSTTKSTQINLLFEYLNSENNKVLNNKVDVNDMENLMRTIAFLNMNIKNSETCENPIYQKNKIQNIDFKCVHLEESKDYDFILQERSLLTCLAYGFALSDSTDNNEDLIINNFKNYKFNYNNIIILTGTTKKYIDPNSKAVVQITKIRNIINDKYKKLCKYFNLKINFIDITNKTENDVFLSIKTILKI